MKRIFLILTLGIFGIYLGTICPTVYLGDSGELTVAAYALGIPHNSGYPLYALVGKIFCLLPIGSVGFRVNLMSSIFALLALWCVFSIIRRFTSSRLAAFLGPLILAFTPVFWQQTTGGEVYGMHIFFVALLIRMVLWWEERRDLLSLVTLAFIAGLSFCNHLQTVMLAPSIFFILLTGDRKALIHIKPWIFVSMFFCAALLIYLYLPIRTDAGAAIHWGDPNTLARFLAHVTGKTHRGTYTFSITPIEYIHRIRDILTYVYHQFGWFLIFVIWGWLRGMSLRRRIFFAGIILFDMVYAVFLNIVSIEITPFLLPSLSVFAVLGALGAARIFEWIKRNRLVTGRLVPQLVGSAICILICIRIFLNWDIVDQSRNYTAYDHATNIVRTLGNRNVLVMDGDNNVFPVLYGRTVARMREDVTLFDRQNLFFKMPLFHNTQKAHDIFPEGALPGYGNERETIKRGAGQGVYFALYNPYAVSVPENHSMAPFGILYRLVGAEAPHSHVTARKIWTYYTTESLYEDFQRDYMTREVTACFYFNKGKWYMAAGKPPVALKYLKLASETGYNDEMIHSDIGIFLADHGFFREAQVELEKALIYNEDQGLVYNNWGYYYAKIQKHDKAIASFRKAVAFNPGNVGYYNNLAYMLSRTGRKAEAIRTLRKSLAIRAEQPVIQDALKRWEGKMKKM
ncbi:MAG: DUF2723 domain-containing protein [Deltaproteobacteria bacterium]|nr:DUF2723 domain-containing protein [Deltaproteobacteria bacterium]